MSVGAKWLRQAERAAAERSAQLLDTAERELGDLLPGARIERGTGDLRISMRRLVRRWLADPMLRFLLWRAN